MVTWSVHTHVCEEHVIVVSWFVESINYKNQ